MTVPKAFEELALSFYGCDGGNLKSPVWFCGLEWGGELHWDNDVNINTLATERGYQTPFDQEAIESDYMTNVSWSDGFEGAVTNGVNQKICWFLNYYLAIDPTDSYDYAQFVIDHKICHKGDDGLGFKMNLFPMNAPNHDYSWDVKRAQFTGFESRSAYEEWCLKHRGEYFRVLLKKYQPEIIIVLGKTHVHKFIQFFGCEDAENFELDKNGVSISYRKIPNTDTYLIISPFFGGASGINSFNKMKDLTNLVHEIKGTQPYDWKR